MRDDRIQYTRHPNLRQHVISRFKNRTNHALPNPDISLATDRTGPRRMSAPHLCATMPPSSPCADTAPPFETLAIVPAAAESRPRPKIAPRCVLTPAVAESIAA